MYKWQLNASTGDYIANLSDNKRLIRLKGGGIYVAEYWGDYSLNFPIQSGAYKSPKLALADLDSELLKNLA